MVGALKSELFSLGGLLAVEEFKITGDFDPGRLESVLRTEYHHRLPFGRESKTVEYCRVKIGYHCEAYLTNLQHSQQECRVLAQFRTGAHALCSEVGRRVLDPAARLCRCCAAGVLEDPHHLVFVCPRYHGVRKQYAVLFPANRTLSAFLNSEMCMVVAGYLCRRLNVRQQYLSRRD